MMNKKEGFSVELPIKQWLFFTVVIYLITLGICDLHWHERISVALTGGLLFGMLSGIITLLKYILLNVKKDEDQ